MGPLAALPPPLDVRFESQRANQDSERLRIRYSTKVTKNKEKPGTAWH